MHESVHLWLRAETKAQEQRTSLTPEGVKSLLEAGLKVTIEDSTQNIFPIDAYQGLADEYGCEIVPAGSWPQAPDDAIILGLKELPEDDFPLKHRHIYFAHAYKDQAGGDAILDRFVRGGGKLYDLEFLLDDTGRRVAAFGYWAGYAGAAVGIAAWANEKKGKSPLLNPLSSLPSKDHLIAEVNEALDGCGEKPRVLVIGARGRSGTGATDMARALGLDVTPWGQKDTADPETLKTVTDYDVLVNCVLVDSALPPFVTFDSLEVDGRKLTMISDVSCDPFGSYNPIRIYNDITTFADPVLEVKGGDVPLNLIAIDHLPSLLPKESSEDYGNQLVPWLKTLTDIDSGIWKRAEDIFLEKSGQNIAQKSA